MPRDALLRRLHERLIVEADTGKYYHSADECFRAPHGGIALPALVYGRRS